MSGTASNPPFVITPAILRQVAAIGEALGRLSLSLVAAGLPRLRRQNRIRTIQASLAIEGNTLNLEQVTAIHDALKEAAATGSSQKGSLKSSQKIMALMQADPEVTIARLARELGCSDRTIKNQINKLRDQGKLRRVGPDKGGRWEVVVKE